MSPLGRPGAGRTLAAAYAVFAVAAGARSAVQIADRFGDAPVAYSLSALAAGIYLVLALSINRPERHRVATAACLAELGGVVAVGLIGLLDESALGGDETVWSGFGEGYVWLPLLLPVLGLTWLRGEARREELVRAR
jgi:hypothetical protein